MDIERIIRMSYVYTRKPNYYETDMMGIVHHSNHIRYFEESRLAYFSSIDCDVAELERQGVIIPNVDAYAKYLVPLKFGDTAAIEVKLTTFTGARMELTYVIKNDRGETAAEGHTMHCFVNSDFKPISLKRKYPEYYNKLMNILEK